MKKFTVYPKLVKSNKVLCSSDTNDTFSQLKALALQSSDASIVYDSEFSEYIDSIYMAAFEELESEYEDTDLYIEPSIQGGSGRIFLYGWGGEYSWDYEDECDEIFEYILECETASEFKQTLKDYLDGKVCSLADVAPYDED